MNTSGKALVALYLHRKGEQVLSKLFNGEEINLNLQKLENLIVEQSQKFKCSKVNKTDRLIISLPVAGATSEAGPGGGEDCQPQAGGEVGD